MRLVPFTALLFTVTTCFAQVNPVTVPVTLDRNRIIIDVQLPLPDGTSKRVRAWFDNGNPDLWIDQPTAELLNLRYTGEPGELGLGSLKFRTATVPAEIVIGDMKIPLGGIKQAKVVLADRIAPGLNAAINLPSTLLRNYDVLVDFPNRELTLAPTGTLKFHGIQSKIFVNDANGLVQVPSKIENKNYNLALDLGSSTSFISTEIFDLLVKKHSDWPQMTGAIAAANLWGLPEEAQWKLLRLHRLQFGSSFLTDVAVVSLPLDAAKWLSERAGMAIAGFVGGNALINQRVGIAYSRKHLYLEVGSAFKAPDMDVIALVLRPEPDGNYRVIGIPDYDGQPAVPDVKVGDLLIAVDRTLVKGSTMGQIWSLLGGTPGDSRILTLERNGQPLTVKAPVHRFLDADLRKQDKQDRVIAPLPVPRR